MHEDRSRYAHTTFCDDVRIEKNGKLLFIGVYASDMVVPSFPFTQRLFVISYLYSESDSPLSKLEHCIYRDGEEIARITLPEDHLRNLQQKSMEAAAQGEPRQPNATRLPPGEVARKMIVVSSAIELRLAKFEQPCVLRVRFQTEKGIVRAGALDIRAKESTSQSASLDTKASSSSSDRGAV